MTLLLRCGGIKKFAQGNCELKNLTFLLSSKEKQVCLITEHFLYYCI